MTTKYYTTQEIAEKLSVNVETVRRWLKGGKLSHVKLGKAYRVTEEDLQAFLKKGY